MSNSKHPPSGEQSTLDNVLAVLDRRPGKLSETRLRDMRSAVKGVANLLGDEPAAIPLDMPTISSRLNTITPLAVGMSGKRFSNVKSDFIAAVRLSGLKPTAGSRRLKS